MMTWSSVFFHSPVTNMMEYVTQFHDYLMLILVSVLITVMINMSYMVKSNFLNFNFSEHHTLESAWTFVPFMVLLLIIAPSLSVLYILDSCVSCGMTIGVVGHQWYWSYFYGIMEGSFDSYMIPEEATFLRLVDVDNRLVIPNSIPTRFAVTSADVIHSWTLPSLGMKMDAIPGRLNQFCCTPKKEGVFFGQCSEICGANHSFMPIVAEIVNLSDFNKL